MALRVLDDTIPFVSMVSFHCLALSSWIKAKEYPLTITVSASPISYLVREQTIKEVYESRRQVVSISGQACRQCSLPSRYIEPHNYKSKEMGISYEHDGSFTLKSLDCDLHLNFPLIKELLVKIL